MIDLITAENIIEDYLKRTHGDGLAIYREYTKVFSEGWLFIYQSKVYVKTGDKNYRLGGNAPLILTHHGDVHVTGTRLPTEVYLELFVKHKYNVEQFHIEKRYFVPDSWK